MIAEVIESITQGITALIAPVVSAIKTAFMNFLYVDPAAETLVMSDLAKFLLVFLGVSIGVSLVWVAISLFKRRK